MSFFIKNNVRFRSESTRNRSDSEWKLGVCSEDVGHRKVLVDTGATGDFIDQDFVTREKLPTRKLSQPIPVYNVDGTLNEARSIREVVDVIMTYEQHSEHILLAVTRLGKQSMILGFTWLDKHNPEIDFRTQSVKMTRCLPCCCLGCQADRKAERNARREDTERINTCRTGPFPAFVEDADEEDETEPTPEQFPDPEVVHVTGNPWVN